MASKVSNLPAAATSGFIDIDDLADSALVDIAYVAQILNVTKQTARRYVREGKLPDPIVIIGTHRWRVGPLRKSILKQPT